MSYGLTYGTAPYDAPQGAAQAAGTDVLVSVELKLGGMWRAINSTEWSAGSVTRGRDDDLSPFPAGRASVLLRNETRSFDPTYTSSPYYPYVRPSLPVRIRGTYAGVTYSLFSGTTDSFDISYDMPNVSTVELQASDGFKVLARARLAASVWEATIRDQGGYKAFYRLSDPVGSLATDQGSQGLHGTYNGSPAQQAASLPVREPDYGCGFDGIDDYVSLPNAAGVTGTVWSFEAWIQCPTFDVAGTSARGFWSQGTDFLGVFPSNHATTPGRVTATINGTVITGTTVVTNLQRVYVVLTRNGTEIRLYVNGALEKVAAVSTTATAQTAVVVGRRNDSATLHWLGYLDEVVAWDETLSAAQIALHYEAGTTPLDGQTAGERVGQILDWVGWPGTERELDVGDETFQSTDLGGRALEYLQTAEVSENGALFMAGDGTVRFMHRQGFETDTTSLVTYGDGAGEIGYQSIVPEFGDMTVLAEARVSRLGGVVQSYSDAAAVVEFGPQGIERNGLFHDTDQGSAYHAQWLVNLRKEPALRFVKITVPAHDTPATYFPDVLGRRLQDRVTVKRRPPGGGAPISQVSLVEGITHTFRPKEWTTTLALSSQRTLAFWLAGVAGHSEAGVTTRAGF